MGRPLDGIRVLSVERGVALAFATRHLAALGAEVVRVESHAQPVGTALDPDLLRAKRRVGLDLAANGAPGILRRLILGCDVFAHEFTPRESRQLGIDYDALHGLRPDLVYLSVTGFGATGPWAGRRLGGASAEAMSGHNDLIGPEHAPPGRPGTEAYGEHVGGLTAAFAVMAALDHHDATGEGACLDVSLYEALASHLGPVMAERSFGAPLPARTGNSDGRYAVHGVFATRGPERYVAISAARGQVAALAGALGLPVDEDADDVQAVLAAALASREGAPVVAALQEAGIAAAEVADAASVATDAHLWSRGYFGVQGTGAGAIPVAGPAFGGGAGLVNGEPHALGEDNEWALSDIAGLPPQEIAAAIASGVVGARSEAGGAPPVAIATRIGRGELSRVDSVHDGWRPFLR